MEITQQGYVRTEIDAAGIARITFFHPNHNSLPSRLLDELVENFLQAGKNPSAKIIVLASAEHKTFCAGASFDELMSIENFEQGLKFFSGFGRVVNSMRTCGKIVVCRVHGKAVGGGVGLASAADFCFATKFAAVRLSELAVGFGPFVIGPAVERRVGISAFSQMALTPADWQTAEFAREKGLFQQVFDSTEAMDEHLDVFCKTLAAYSPEALAELKKIFWANTEHWETLLEERAAISGQLCLTDFSKNAITAFKSGR